MADIDLTYINAAAIRTGSETISRLDDGSLVGKIAAQTYEILVKNELSLNAWKQATKTVVLNRIDPATMGEPPEPWTAAYTVPTDLIDIRTVKVDGLPINYEVFGNVILCDADSSSDVILHYVWRVPENRWHAAFAEGITQRLEALFWRGKEQHDKADKRDKSAELQIARARHRDAAQQTSRNPYGDSSPTLDARRG
jgi:hypothetical protein